jgi:hypothetical protein
LDVPDTVAPRVARNQCHSSYARWGRTPRLAHLPPNRESRSLLQ